MSETTHLSKRNTHFSEVGIETKFLKAHLMKKIDAASPQSCRAMTNDQAFSHYYKHYQGCTNLGLQLALATKLFDGDP
jgi:hypothetical protein